MATQENLNKFKIGQCHNVGNCTHIGEKQAIPSDIANSGGFKCKYCGAPLKEIEKSKSFWEKYGKALMAVVAIFVLAGLGFGAYKLTSGKTVKIENIALNKDKLILKVGENILLEATIEPKDAKVTYIWESSDEDIVSVSDGQLKALKAGSAIITVSADNNDKKATCVVEVKAKEVIIPGSQGGNVITKLTITDTKDFTMKKGDSKQLQYQADPAQNSETPIWESSDPSIAAIDANGNVTAIKKGTATITVKAKEVSSIPVTVTVTEDATTVDPINPSYGRYTGERNSQGQPHGFGDLVFTKSKLVTGSTYAEPGYKIRNARYVNGKLQSGTLYDADGNKVCFIDANNNL